MDTENSIEREDKCTPMEKNDEEGKSQPRQGEDDVDEDWEGLFN